MYSILTLHSIESKTPILRSVSCQLMSYEDARQILKSVSMELDSRACPASRFVLGVRVPAFYRDWFYKFSKGLLCIKSLKFSRTYYFVLVKRLNDMYLLAGTFQLLKAAETFAKAHEYAGPILIVKAFIKKFDLDCFVNKETDHLWDEDES